MNVSGKHLLACAILLALGHTINAEYDIMAYCSIVRIGHKLPSIDNCRTYYTCGRTNKNKNNEPTFTISQCDSGEKFDKDTQSCRSAENVNCFIGEALSCAGKDKEYIPVLGTCDEYTWCVNSKPIGNGKCPSGSCFDTTKSACVNCKCADNINTASGGQEFKSVCAIMPADFYFGSTVVCNRYQWCETSGALKDNECPTGFGAYIVETNQCGYKGADALNTCLRVTGDDILPNEDKEVPCIAADLGKQKPSDTKCSRFMQCDGNLWKIKNCPTGNYYDIKLERCVKRSVAQPSPTCNRCEYFKVNRDFYWANTVDSTCQGYVRCDDGKQVGTKKKCSTFEYFDEMAQSCILDESTESLKEYIKLNGACANDGIDCPTKCETLTGDECITTGTCQCKYNDGECKDCGTDDCDGCKLEDDLASCATAIDTSCYVKDGQCTYCSPGETATIDDCIRDVPCDCSEHTDLDDCVDDTDCSCGIKDGECIDCNDDDCNQCKEATDLVDCAEATKETCYVNTDEECVYCDVGEIAENDDCVPE